MRLTVFRESENRLAIHVWTFYVSTDFSRPPIIYLDTYREKVRLTRRHSYREVRWYDRLPSGHSGHIAMQASDVPLPDDVAAEARETLVSLIAVKKWDR